MIKFIISIYIILSTTVGYGQDFSLTKKHVKVFNAQIKSLEKTNPIKSATIKSLPQTTAHYFEIYTKSPQAFIKSLAETKNFDQLANTYPNLQIDKDLLIIKHISPAYNNEREIEITSFEIGNSSRHSVTLKYSDSLNNDHLPYFFKAYTSKNMTTISGFYLKANFVSIDIPDKYTNWINYNDKLIMPDKPIFLKPVTNLIATTTRKKNSIDTLISYFNTKSNRPNFLLIEDIQVISKQIDDWKFKKPAIAVSLYKKDKKFKQLLNDALNYAEKYSLTNEDLEDIAYSTIPKNRTLNLLRQSQTIGTCSFDERPLAQLKRIAMLAAETADWGLFIRSTLNVLNDNVSRVAQSNIASNNRKTYIEELAKLDLDLNLMLLGSNFRVSDTTTTHYFSDGAKIAKAYNSLPIAYQDIFEKAIIEILKNPNMDSFNKLHFYNTYQNFKYLLKDSLKIKSINDNSKQLTSYLPYEIKSRIENTNKSLTDLLYRESDLLNRFEVINSSMGSIYSYNYGGMCWKAELIEKDANNSMVYNLTMPINEQITPFKNFIKKMDSLKLAVQQSNFLQQRLNVQLNSKIHIEFTIDKSFANHNQNVTGDMPVELIKKLNFNNAISVYINTTKNNYARYVLLENNNILSINSSLEPGTKDTYNLYNENGDKIY